MNHEALETEVVVFKYAQKDTYLLTCYPPVDSYSSWV